jgi:hypothetical protein
MHHDEILSSLRRHIATLLEKKARVTLGEVTAVYPLTQGLSEIITYVLFCDQLNAYKFCVFVEREYLHDDEMCYHIIQSVIAIRG